MTPTTKLLSKPIPITRTFDDVLRTSSASAAGFHANSEWLTCPERMRLKALGVEPRTHEDKDFADGLNALDFGTLIHELLAYRVIYGHEASQQLLEAWRDEIGTSYVQAALILGTYEFTFPQASDPLKVLAVEAEVVSDVGGGIMRTVRYDGVVQANTPGGATELYSLERKTMSRSGYSALFPYYPQGMTQVALWNSNQTLVGMYGEMKGVIYESIVKTKTPSVDRQPIYFTKRQQRMALQYMRYAEDGTVRYAQAPDGSFPRMLHACWGRYSPCPYIGICHDELVGDYQYKDGSPLI